MSSLQQFHDQIADSFVLRSTEPSKQSAEIKNFINEMLISHGTMLNIKQMLKIDNDFDVLLAIKSFALQNINMIDYNAHFKSLIGQELGIQSDNEGDLLQKIKELKQCTAGILVPITAVQGLTSENSQLITYIEKQKEQLEHNYEKIAINQLIFGLETCEDVNQVIDELRELRVAALSYQQLKTEYNELNGAVKQLMNDLGVEDHRKALEQLRALRDNFAFKEQALGATIKKQNEATSKLAIELEKTQQEHLLCISNMEKLKTENLLLQQRVQAQQQEITKSHEQSSALEEQLKEFKFLLQNSI